MHTYIHACIHTYIHTYIHVSIDACMHAGSMSFGLPGILTSASMVYPGTWVHEAALGKPVDSSAPLETAYLGYMSHEPWSKLLICGLSRDHIRPSLKGSRLYHRYISVCIYIYM